MAYALLKILAAATSDGMVQHALDFRVNRLNIVQVSYAT